MHIPILVISSSLRTQLLSHASIIPGSRLNFLLVDYAIAVVFANVRTFRVRSFTTPTSMVGIIVSYLLRWYLKLVSHSLGAFIDFRCR